MLSHPYRNVCLNAPIPFTVQEQVPSPDPRSLTPSLTPLTPPPAHYKRRKCDAVIRADLPPTPPPSAPHSPLPKHHHHHRGNNVDDDDVEDIDDDASEELEWRPPMQHPLPFAVQPPSVSSYITPAMHPDSHTRPPKPHDTHKSRVAIGATGASTPSTPSLSASGNPSRISVSSVDTRTPEVYCVYMAPNLQRAGSSASHSSSSYYNSGSRSNSGDSTHTAGWHSSSSSSSMASLEPSSDGLSCPYPQAGSSATGGTSSGSRFRKGYSMVVNGPRTGSLRSLFKKGGCEV